MLRKVISEFENLPTLKLVTNELVQQALDKWILSNPAAAAATTSSNRSSTTFNLSFDGSGKTLPSLEETEDVDQYSSVIFGSRLVLEAKPLSAMSILLTNDAIQVYKQCFQTVLAFATCLEYVYRVQAYQKRSVKKVESRTKTTRNQVDVIKVLQLVQSLVTYFSQVVQESVNLLDGLRTTTTMTKGSTMSDDSSSAGQSRNDNEYESNDEDVDDLTDLSLWSDSDIDESAVDQNDKRASERLADKYNYVSLRNTFQRHIDVLRRGFFLSVDDDKDHRMMHRVLRQFVEQVTILSKQSLSHQMVDDRHRRQCQVFEAIQVDDLVRKVVETVKDRGKSSPLFQVLHGLVRF
ncbi:hypothetical protein OIV83_005326 [Microbotryomycetes sp. JL201]|nr:hypothetical protein OIV83_005326 [Microbotryomycetes sp. JL201]